MSDASPPPAPLPSTPDEKRKGRLHGWRLTILAGVFVVLVFANAFIHLPYYVLSPGDTTAVNQFVELPADKEHKPKGQIMLTTVSLLRARPFDIVWAWMTEGTDIEKRKAVLGDSTPKQFNELSAQQMDGSQLAAKYVALQRAGLQVSLKGDGVIVRAVSEGVPAQGKLNPGDVIVRVDGKAVGLSPELTKAIRVHRPGETVRLDVQDATGATRTVDVATAPLPTDPSIAYVGVQVETKNLDLVTPFPVNFKSTKIGGPSAGLAFTLALLDDVTPGELTGGSKVAATGTMAGDGTVGEVGGIEQKTRTVRKSGASMFLVPAAEADEARRFAGSKLKIVAVDNLEQAIDALKAGGGDASGLPPAITLKPAA